MWFGIWDIGIVNGKEKRCRELRKRKSDVCLLDVRLRRWGSRIW